MVSGYNKEDILGKNIKVLMPKFIANKHDDILLKYVRTCQKFTENHISSFLLKKDKSIQPINIYIKLISNMEGEIEMVGMIREVKSRVDKVDYLLLDEHEILQGGSKGVQEDLGIIDYLIDHYDFDFKIFAPDLSKKIFYEKNVSSLNLDKKKSIENKNSQSSQLTKQANSSSSKNLGMFNFKKRASNVSDEESSSGDEIIETENKRAFSILVQIPKKIKKYLDTYQKNLGEYMKLTYEQILKKREEERIKVNAEKSKQSNNLGVFQRKANRSHSKIDNLMKKNGIALKLGSKQELDEEKHKLIGKVNICNFKKKLTTLMKNLDMQI